MTTATIQVVAPHLSDRLRERLGSLGVTVVTLEASGAAAAVGESSWLERVLLATPQFAAQAARLRPRLAEPGQGEAIGVWPGVWLVPLPGPRRRRAAADGRQPPVTAALLVGEEFLESDQFRLVCDAARLDRRAAALRVERAGLVSAGEARRLAATLAWMQQDSLEIDRRYHELTTLSQELGESYEELSLVYKLSTSMMVNQPPAQFLTDACAELQQVVGLKWMAIQLTDGEPRLNELVGRIFTAGPVGCDEGLLRRVGERIMLQQPAASKPMIVDDTRTLGIPHLPRLASSLLVVSMLREGKPFGIIYGGDKHDGSHISSVDSKLCNSLASSLSIFLDNMILYEDMEAMFLGTLHALTSSIDAKDSYTRGHSERVALLSRELAIAAGLEGKTVERVYIAGLVHDVGKIGVPEAVLCKPGRLTEDEFGLIKMHPEIGARILQDIRQMKDLVPGVLYHHERWDGAGYPYGLRGRDVPLFGRLICLADSFDAMSSNRTYRSAMAHDKVLEEVRRCAGTQFDPRLAELFVGLDFSPFFDLIQRHHSGAILPQEAAT